MQQGAGMHATRSDSFLNCTTRFPLLEIREHEFFIGQSNHERRAASVGYGDTGCNSDSNGRGELPAASQTCDAASGEAIR